MVDAAVLVREYLLTQAAVTDLLGTNLNGSIYCSYDLPEHCDPNLGPVIQIFLAGGSSHPEILPLVEARLQLRTWAAVEKDTLAADLYGAVNDVLHGTCNVPLDNGFLMSALEKTGPQEITETNTGWVSMNSFYAVMARPN